MSDFFKDKVILITGAASGIGKAAAQLFAKGGAVVLVADINLDAGQKVVDDINSDNGRAYFLFLDVADEASWIKAIAEIESKHQKLNVLVNNAAVPLGGPTETFALEDW